WLPQGTIILGLDATIWIGLITMVGGLCGYFILMGYVALGRPQAGLPLLNSGAILGYFISTLILLGISALEFNISF
ncbi:MAG: presenilin family intramembrane aspartyl protease, partial [Candidatus Thermoplasmatota archaeon]|nr:presenilin family intramembrane aspartyl protease [Candidatus Thermoplasmatota archaeon]